MIKSIAEILKEISKEKSFNTRVEMLKKNDSLAMRTLLQGTFDPRIEFDLPDTDPPYKPTEMLDQQGHLYQQARKFPIWVKGQQENLPKFKKERLFIELLESIDPEDAKLVLAMKNKQNPLPNITPKLVLAVWPGLFPEETK